MAQVQHVAGAGAASRLGRLHAARSHTSGT
jgi:hypothetical protein